jgi:FixJ family two-component response regulator
MRLPFTTGPTIGLSSWAMGRGDPVKVLLIDDDDDDASLTRSLLSRVDDVRYELDWVSTFGEGLTAIGRDEHEAYLVDHRLGARTGIELVREARTAGSLAALIMLTGQRDRGTDVAAMDAGATDFLMKGRTDAAMLDRTLRYSITQTAVTAALERSRGQMAGLEELGRILVAEGPTTETIGRVVDLIADRFMLRQVAIYLAQGDELTLAGQRGYVHPATSVSRADASVERVARARYPLFLPSLSPETDAYDHETAVATELSVPLMFDGELVGLMNVASPAAAPIGEADYTAIRLIGDRLSTALEVTNERRVAERRLSNERRRSAERAQASSERGIVDPETSAYRRELLEPLLEVAIASAGKKPEANVGMLLVTSRASDPVATALFAEHARAMFEGRPRVRFGPTQVAVLVARTDERTARQEARDLMSSMDKVGAQVWSGFAPLTSSSTAASVIKAAERALASAQRAGPPTLED